MKIDELHQRYVEPLSRLVHLIVIIHRHDVRTPIPPRLSCPQHHGGRSKDSDRWHAYDMCSRRLETSQPLVDTCWISDWINPRCEEEGDIEENRDS